jgi:hypothetical protein
LERALAIRSTTGLAKERLGETEFALANALLAIGRDRERARDLAHKALAHYGQSSAQRRAREEISAWLSKNGDSSIVARRERF